MKHFHWLALVIVVSWEVLTLRSKCAKEYYVDQYTGNVVSNNRSCVHKKKMKREFGDLESARVFLNGFPDNRVPQFGHDLKPLPARVGYAWLTEERKIIPTNVKVFRDGIVIYEEPRYYDALEVAQ